MPRNHERRSIRLRHYDYAQPAIYFVTICAYNKRVLFGEVGGGEVVLYPLGEIVDQEWLRTSNLRPEVILDEYVIMPNHIHAILKIAERSLPDRVGAHRDAPLHRPPRSLGSIIAGFKGAVTRRAREQSDDEIEVWQRNYYERVIRDGRELNRPRRTIRQNPLRWELDHYFSP